jgi:hypothetical protein
MAFSATIRNQAYMGPGIRRIWGEWTGTAGDAAGSMVVSGYVTEANFQKLDPLDSTNQILARVGKVVASGKTTLTIQNQDNVTDGYFWITTTGQ